MNEEISSTKEKKRMGGGKKTVDSVLERGGIVRGKRT